MFSYGLWLLAGPSITSIIQEQVNKAKRKNRIKRIKEVSESQNQYKRSSLYNHLEVVLAATRKTYHANLVSNFLFLSITLFVISFVFLYILLDDIILSGLLGVFLGILPYVFIRIKLLSIQSKTSLSFARNFHVILSNYQSTNDIYFAIIDSIKQISEPNLKITLIKLANAMQLQKNLNDFAKAEKIFIYSINSQFAKRFGKLLIKAHIYRSDVYSPMLLLDEDISKRMIDMEEEKTRRLQNVMQGYFPLFAIPFSLFISYRISGVLDYWYYFTRKLPLTLFIIVLILSIISIMLATILKKPRTDI